MKVKIRPCVLRGTVQAPPSKSYAHRLMICAALAEGRSEITGIAQSEDMLATADCIASLGAKCKLKDGTAEITGERKEIPDGAVFPCRESGSTLRFLIPAAMLSGGEAVFTGTKRLLERGIGVYEDIFREKGIDVLKSEDKIVLSGKLTSGRYSVPGFVSSQFISGLLFALPLLDGDSEIEITGRIESGAYIDITLDAMRLFGVRVDRPSPERLIIPGSQKYLSRNAATEGDWSNAAALLAFNLFGGEISVTGLNKNSLQGDRVCTELFEKIKKHEEIDISGCPDLGPVLFAASAAEGEGKFTGTRRLKIKESDRAETMARELRKFGAEVMVGENAVEISCERLNKPQEILCGSNDHRIVMALTLLSSITGGEISEAQSVSKSWPDFFTKLKALGLEAEYEI